MSSTPTVKEIDGKYYKVNEEIEIKLNSKNPGEYSVNHINNSNISIDVYSLKEDGSRIRKNDGSFDRQPMSGDAARKYLAEASSRGAVIKSK